MLHLVALLLLVAATHASAQEAGAVAAQVAQTDLLDKIFSIKLDAQPVSTAVIELSKQTGVQVAMAGDSLDQVYTSGIQGQFTLREALTRLLEGTDFEFRQAGANTITIKATRLAPTGGAGGFGRPAVAANEAPPASAPQTAAQPDSETIAVAALPIKTVPEAAPPREDENVTELDTITVTAGKRTQNIRDVPGSVSALGGEELAKRGAQSLEDYLKLVPGVTFSKGGVDGGVPIIRGIATGTGLDQTPVPVGIYLDEAPFGDLFLPTSVTDVNPFDLERVEVLKGPQGTLFGSGSLAGAIRYITHKPELNVWQGKLLGSYTEVQDGGSAPGGAAMLNIPLGQTAAVRITGLRRESPGVIDDTRNGDKDVDQVKQSAARVLAAWLPSERLSLNLLYLQQRSRQASEDFADQQQRRERSDTTIPTPRESAFDLGNLTASYDFDWGSLLSSTSRKSKDIYNQSDLSRNTGAGTTEDPGAEDQDLIPVVLPLDATVTGFNQELRLTSPEDASRWQWLAGISFQSDRAYFLNVQPTPFLDQLPLDPNGLPIFPTPGTPVGPVGGTRDAQLQYILINAKATEQAVFGEVSRKLGERWEVTAGARLFKTRLVADTFFSGVVLAAVAARIETTGRSIIEEDGVNPKFSLAFRANENISLYALAAKGFQFGGVQILPATLTTTSIAGMDSEGGFTPYKSSDLWNYELGARTDWFDRRLRFDATLFYLRWKNLQLTQQDANRVFSFVGNVGRAHSAGAELALQLTPGGGLRWQSSVAFINAVTDVFFEAPAGNVEPGTLLPGTARFSMANVLSYDLPLPILGFTPGVNLTHTHTGRRFNNLQHAREMAAYDQWDFSLNLPGSGWRVQPELSLGVTNLFDVLAVSSIGDRSRVDDVTFIRPRTATASLTVRF